MESVRFLFFAAHEVCTTGWCTAVSCFPSECDFGTTVACLSSSFACERALRFAFRVQPHPPKPPCPLRSTFRSAAMCSMPPPLVWHTTVPQNTCTKLLSVTLEAVVRLFVSSGLEGRQVLQVRPSCEGRICPGNFPEPCTTRAVSRKGAHFYCFAKMDAREENCPVRPVGNKKLVSRPPRIEPRARSADVSGHPRLVHINCTPERQVARAYFNDAHRRESEGCSPAAIRM